MKNTYRKISSLFMTAVVVFFMGCDTDLDINTDPDLLAPDAVPMASELPAALTGIAGSAGSYFAIFGGFWSQYWTQSAVANQYKQIDDYSLNTTDNMINGAWSSMFDALTDVRNIKANALAEENWNYYLIATTLEVYANQILIDFYGSIPYAEANNTAILNPAFNTAEEVYDLMVSDLKGALSKDLSASPIDNAPGDTDFVFEGDMDEWKAFANTMLLKLYLRQSEVRPSVAQSGITTLMNSGATFLSSDAAITQFTDEDSKSNPLYETDRRQLNVATNLRASTTMGSFLQANSDTRLSYFYDGTSFQNQGDFEDGSSTSSVVELAPEDPYYFMSLAESLFLQAEARVRYMGGNGAQALYEAGLTAAFDQWGEDASSFISGAYAYPNGTDAENIEAIVVQKWVSLFPGNGFEAFFEHNRTGYPQESAVSQSELSYVPGQFAYSVEGLTGGLFPKRLEYPQDESQRNSNAPNTVIKITEPVWYDVN
ncbi:SusD/RagB family nutrient-binding outer membrane lipoprotein [Aestuariibaculum sp. YM273]|uniref:SusD/RagB family nutrient-binding outer membrane lipoprotein n=1 Tax=Aestuariibaculum sp. YM273 TaxID=3070659 RepID=UPI0027DCD949|nr:SusD/RagB family nutrient-binding outer membrane lipoprotein [Aestuariibaculum sp. YM273]WMI66095.1 SusD/RagB family nutrient-binding outer membrane lipoprotein [Aestuariibaculum sp. YM273]